MSKQRPLRDEFEPEELDAIRRFLDRMVAAAKSGKTKAKEAIAVSQSRQTLNQYTYWQNVERGFRWALKILPD